VKIAAQAQFENELKPLISDMEPDKLTLLALVQAKKADLVLEYVHHTFPGKEPWLQGQCKQIITDGFRSRTNKEDTAEEFLKMILPGPTTRGDHKNVEQSTSTDGTSANQSSAARYGQLKPNPGGNSATTYAHPEWPEPQIQIFRSKSTSKSWPATISHFSPISPCSWHLTPPTC
jgi:hypothetical protein